MERPHVWEPALTDSFKRRIDYLRISLTARCNLRCIYCMPAGGLPVRPESDQLTSGEIVRIARAAASCGISKVRLTGGEPLLRQDIVPLVAALKQVAGIPEVSLTTNGMMFASRAVQLRQAGLDRVNISLDTMDPRRFRMITRGGELSRVWGAIAAAEEAGLAPVKINMVPMAGVNDDEILSFAALTFEKDYHIRFIERMPVGPADDDRAALIGTDEIRRRIEPLGRLAPLAFRGQGPSRNYRIEGARGVIGLISPVSDHFCDSCNRLRLTANGRLRPCLFAEREVDLRTPLRRGVSDEALRDLFAEAVLAKPAGHALHESGRGAGGLASLSQIGG